MLKIGDFSRLAHVTVKTLRLYGQMGLLKPALIDRYTGYRYYTLDQLPRLNRILALKDLGFSLDQIQTLLKDELPLEQLRGMLRIKQSEIELRVQQEQARLTRVANRVKLIEQESQLGHFDVLVRPVPDLLTLSIQVVVAARDQIPAMFFQMRKEINRCLEMTRLEAENQWIILQHNAEYAEKNVDLEVCRVLADGCCDPAIAILRNERARVRTLPGIQTAASFVHPGPVETLPDVVPAMVAWAELNHYRVGLPVREVYWFDLPEGEGRETIVELQLPLESWKKEIEENHMVPEIVTLPAFWVAGTRYAGNNKHGEIHDMWENEFLPRVHEIKRVDPHTSYGVCHDFDDTGTFIYIAGVEVASEADVPAGMVFEQVPEQKYAVFKHIGPLDMLGKTNEMIYQTALPQAGLKRAKGPDLELYNDEYNGETPDSVLYLYVPVE